MPKITLNPNGTIARVEGKRDVLFFEPDYDAMDGGYHVEWQTLSQPRTEPKSVGWLSPMPYGKWHASLTVRGITVTGEAAWPDDLVSDLLSEIEAAYESEMSL